LACAAGVAKFSWEPAGFIEKGKRGDTHSIVVHVGELYLARPHENRVLTRLDKEKVTRCPLYKLWMISSLPREVKEWLSDAT